jgi:hypothetical protein
MIMTGLTIFLGLALILAKLPRRLMLKALGRPLAIDLLEAARDGCDEIKPNSITYLLELLRIGGLRKNASNRSPSSLARAQPRGGLARGRSDAVILTPEELELLTAKSERAQKRYGSQAVELEHLGARI